MMDPSLLLRPEPTFAAKPVGMFRDYSIDPEDPIKERVRVTYHKMHTYQTVDFVRGKHKVQVQCSERTEIYTLCSDGHCLT